MNEDVKSTSVHIHSRADELITCLEGEIAKRDARIVELEARIVWLECESQDSAAPVAKPQGVVMPEQIQRALDFSRNFADSKPDIGISERLHILGLANLLEKEASLNAAPVQQVSVPDGYVRVPVEPTEAMIFAGCEALVGSIGGYEAGQVERCYDAMLAAANAPGDDQ